MEIKKVISKGEILNAEQLAQVTGGAGVKDNVNDFEYCKCEGAGDNINREKACSCKNPPIYGYDNGTTSCGSGSEPANSKGSNC